MKIRKNFPKQNVMKIRPVRVEGRTHMSKPIIDFRMSSANAPKMDLRAL
jgi:hypothetical protein